MRLVEVKKALKRQTEKVVVEEKTVFERGWMKE